MQHVRSVVSVDLSLLKSNPPQLLISAVGTVPTGGWKDGTLEPRFYLVPPADGIQEFDFVGSPPFGPVIQVILPIAAQAVIADIPQWLQGVRVYSAGNKVESRLSGSKEVKLA